LVLDLIPPPFSFPQDRIPIREKRERRKIQILMGGQNLGHTFTRDEKMEILLFSMNLSERE